MSTLVFVHTVESPDYYRPRERNWLVKMHYFAGEQLAADFIVAAIKVPHLPSTYREFVVFRSYQSMIEFGRNGYHDHVLLEVPDLHTEEDYLVRVLDADREWCEEFKQRVVKELNQ